MTSMGKRGSRGGGGADTLLPVVLVRSRPWNLPDTENYLPVSQKSSCRCTRSGSCTVEKNLWCPYHPCLGEIQKSQDTRGGATPDGNQKLHVYSVFQIMPPIIATSKVNEYF